MPTTDKPKKRKSKGKRHLLHAESLERLADAVDTRGGYYITCRTFARMLRAEAKRVKTIVR